MFWTLSMLLELFLTCAALAGCGDEAGDDPPKPPETTIAAPKPAQVERVELSRSALRLVGVMHGFRLLTESGTRGGGFGLGGGYAVSVSNLHGWADGDPFYVNYVGHPMQGAVAAHLWTLHDRRYRGVEFGGGTAYWKSRLRAGAFAWAFSEQFEIGPLSEASVGHIQKFFPQQGLADHVVTPTIGLGWMIAEDAMDRYVVKLIEARTHNHYVRAAARTFMNPARSFANLMDLRIPWYRDSRTGVTRYTPAGRVWDTPESEPVQELAPFEFTALAGSRQLSSGACVGGGAEGALRVAAEWQMVLAVNGCKRIGERENVSGDVLVYQLGPRWTPSPSGKWSPFAHLLVGGLKATQEVMDPAAKKRMLEANQQLDPMLAYTLHGRYTTQQESNTLAITAGMGLDYKLNPALAFRVASLEYLHGGGSIAGSGFQMSTGMVLRWGTW
jgi:hypothetical protein